MTPDQLQRLRELADEPMLPLTTDRDVILAAVQAIKKLFPCRDFRPDHNGECLNCDEWADAHDLTPSDPATLHKALEDVGRKMGVEQLVADLVDNPNKLCSTCGHPAKNHTLGRCRKKKCGCGGWRG